MGISKYIPSLNKIIPVYGLIVLLIYGWTIYWFLWNLPSWLSFIPIPDIVGIFAYSLVNNLLESLVVILVLIASGIVLPEKWYRGNFVFRAGLTGIFVLGVGMYLLNNFIPLTDLGKTCVISATILVALHIILGRIRAAKMALETLADRSTIFLYISMPLSLFGLLVVLMRTWGS